MEPRVKDEHVLEFKSTVYLNKRLNKKYLVRRYSECCFCKLTMFNSTVAKVLKY